MEGNPGILWIAGWYPSGAKPFSGDFVQRHARATSIYVPLHLIHLAIVFGNKPENSIARPNKNLTEEIRYVRFIRLGLLGKIWNNYRFFKILKGAVKDYIRLNGTPGIVHFHAPDKTAGIAPWIKKMGSKIVLTEHWAIYNKVVSDNYYARSKWFQKRIVELCKVCDLGIQTGRSIHQDMQEATGIEFPFMNIPNAVDIKQFFYVEDKAFEPFHFVHASILDSRKNVLGILRVFSDLAHKYSSIRLTLVGPKNKEVEALIALKDLSDKVVLTGELPYSQVAEIVRNSNVFVLFSWMENAPCVIFEALCCGLPVVSSGVASVPENIVDGENGFLCTAGNENELKEAMEKAFLKYSDFDTLEISRDSASRFSFETVGSEIYSAYKELLK